MALSAALNLNRRKVTKGLEGTTSPFPAQSSQVPCSFMAPAPPGTPVFWIAGPRILFPKGTGGLEN